MSLVQQLSETLDACIRAGSLGFPSTVISRGILLIGSHGSGRFSLVHSTSLSPSRREATSVAGCQLIVAEWLHADHIVQAFARAKEAQPCVILFSHGELLHQDAMDGLILKEMDALAPSQKIACVAIVPDIADLPPSLRKRFGIEFSLPVPDVSTRKESISRIFGSAVWDESEEVGTDIDILASGSRREALLKLLSQRTSGYVLRDLERLYRMSLGCCILRHQRTSGRSDRIPSGELNKIADLRLRWSDIEQSLTAIKPSQLQLFNGELKTAKWEDVGGYTEIKQTITEVVEWPLLHKASFERLGLQPGSGLLLYGPSGCGKTLLVRALASSCSLTFVSVRGPQLLSKWVGETERSIRRLFARARELQPCVLFIDELDALGAKRDMGEGGADSTGVSARLLSSMLNEMDGIQGKHHVLVVACTNRPDLIDAALLRPGRLDRHLYVGIPTETDRKEILQVLTRKMRLDSDVRLDFIASKTENCSCSDLQALCREAALIAFRRTYSQQQSTTTAAALTRVADQTLVTQVDFEEGMKLPHTRRGIGGSRRLMFETFRRKLIERVRG